MASRPPFSRQRDRNGKPDQWAIVRAAEFVAETYRWGPDYLDTVLTDEQLVAYLDAAQTRLEGASRDRFVELVEANRIGAVFAHDAKQYARWRGDADRRSGRRPTKDLAQLSRDFGGGAGNIVRGEFEFRN